ncbi:hypothetical protein BGX29_004156 [Mortierella sp. GBA35]|nr:hypothetical protein BGX23_005397 [Mortierella sp. AD031]KAF9102815.1 hypothetical protein BGX29_004156 [Mortierella sp. GBA35]KAG0213973.1 hypothetical protein BGX33_002576 [Mortierella sp. NVP41]
MREKDLLSSFLVGNELHDSVTLTKFASYFPSAYRSHPEIKDLYRAYMNARHQVRTRVKRNIEIEARRNPFNANQGSDEAVLKLQEQQDVGMALEGFDELEADSSMAVDMDIEDVDKHLTLDQAIQELALAEKIYKKEIGQLEKECNAIAQEFQDLDQEVDSVKVPGRMLEGVNEDALANDLQNLIAMCNSLTGEAAVTKQ